VRWKNFNLKPEEWKIFSYEIIKMQLLNEKHKYEFARDEEEEFL
jgi:hypothetical protein